MSKTEKPEGEWRKALSPDQYHVLREAGTERAFTGKYWDNHDVGMYRCAGCGTPLFASDAKFDSGTGWPSFTTPVDPTAVSAHSDTTPGSVRTDVRCANCDGDRKSAGAGKSVSVRGGTGGRRSIKKK